ncbi:lysophospholipid acyltransferase family protein [Cellulomonas composti]|uniref:lysophospholipid acyltransferase family protein n=1 Tax=Cellulomonas composti TaxID=266130 RepID=UPI0011BE710B|nr:lysophospholipid acyltransferase family protein [Cellulomonas composti]
MRAPARSTLAYRNVARILRPLFMVITKRDWSGGETIPTDRGIIVAANHMTNVDPVTMAHFLWDSGFVPRILAKSSLFTIPVVGWALRRTHQIPVYRNTSAAGESLREATQALDDGECVVVFPEGTLTRDPDLWPMVGKTGVARLALASRAPVIPVAQWGAQDLLGRYSKVPHPIPPKLVTMRVGPAVDLDDLYDLPHDAATLREATERVMVAITTLLEGIRGEQAPAVRFDARRSSARPDDLGPDDKGTDDAGDVAPDEAAGTTDEARDGAGSAEAP